MKLRNSEPACDIWLCYATPAQSDSRNSYEKLSLNRVGGSTGNILKHTHKTCKNFFWDRLNFLKNTFDSTVAFSCTIWKEIIFIGTALLVFTVHQYSTASKMSDYCFNSNLIVHLCFHFCIILPLVIEFWVLMLVVPVSLHTQYVGSWLNLNYYHHTFKTHECVCLSISVCARTHP